MVTERNQNSITAISPHALNQQQIKNMHNKVIHGAFLINVTIWYKF